MFRLVLILSLFYFGCGQPNNNDSAVKEVIKTKGKKTEYQMQAYSGKIGMVTFIGGGTDKFYSAPEKEVADHLKETHEPEFVEKWIDEHLKNDAAIFYSGNEGKYAEILQDAADYLVKNGKES